MKDGNLTNLSNSISSEALGTWDPMSGSGIWNVAQNSGYTRLIEAHVPKWLL
jgi:hypothetical protein